MTLADDLAVRMGLLFPGGAVGVGSFASREEALARLFPMEHPKIAHYDVLVAILDDKDLTPEEVVEERQRWKVALEAIKVEHARRHAPEEVPGDSRGSGPHR